MIVWAQVTQSAILKRYALDIVQSKPCAINFLWICHRVSLKFEVFFIVEATVVSR